MEAYHEPFVIYQLFAMLSNCTSGGEKTLIVRAKQRTMLSRVSDENSLGFARTVIANRREQVSSITMQSLEQKPFYFSHKPTAKGSGQMNPYWGVYGSGVSTTTESATIMPIFNPERQSFHPWWRKLSFLNWCNFRCSLLVDRQLERHLHMV